ncbi:MAG: hypothetical protein U5Q44_03045 [Dehalococcoidia bacterium]|nr:hypothetical protein [Dehalococcoidia bacterium]
MQFWTSVAGSRDEARARVGASMEGMYRVPFERFEKYTPFGTAKEVAEFVAGFVEDGARHVNFIASQDSPQESIDRIAEVRESSGASANSPLRGPAEIHLAEEQHALAGNERSSGEPCAEW